jgi:glucoamylase
MYSHQCTPSTPKASESASEDTPKTSTTAQAPPKAIHGSLHPLHSVNDRFLCTSAAAEIVYLTTLEAITNESLTTTSLSNIFYNRFLPSVEVGIYPQNSSEYAAILSGMITFADSFLSTVQQHAFQNGSISEEFDRFGPPGFKLM